MSETQTTSNTYSVSTAKIAARYLDDVERLGEALALINWENIPEEERAGYWNALRDQANTVEAYATYLETWLERIGS